MKLNIFCSVFTGLLFTFSLTAMEEDNLDKFIENGFYRYDKENFDCYNAIKEFSNGKTTITVIAEPHTSEPEGYKEINEIIAGKVVLYEQAGLPYKESRLFQNSVKKLPAIYSRLEYLTSCRLNPFSDVFQLTSYWDEDGLNLDLASELIHADLCLPQENLRNIQNMAVNSDHLKRGIWDLALSKINGWKPETQGSSFAAYSPHPEEMPYEPCACAIANLSELLNTSLLRYHNATGKDFDEKTLSNLIGNTQPNSLGEIRRIVLRLSRAILEVRYAQVYADFVKRHDLQAEQEYAIKLKKCRIKPCDNSRCEFCFYIHPRNKILFETLEKVLARQDSPKELVIVYGGDHCDAIEAYLLDREFSIQSVMWFKQFDAVKREPLIEELRAKSN